MPITTGIAAENDFVAAFDGKRFDELGHNLRQAARDLFGPLEPDALFACEKVGGYQKPDVVIAQGERKRYVSIKTGSSRIVHTELLGTFLMFLADHEVPTNIQETFIRWITCDETLDGSGTVKLTALEKMSRSRKEIDEMNAYFAMEKSLLLDAIRRLVFDGTPHCVDHADAIYHGNVHYGVMLSAEQVLSWVAKKDFSWIANPHIGPLIPSPRLSGWNGIAPTNAKQIPVIFRWAGMLSDFPYIKNHFGGLGS